ncbi:insulin gene enhancer protein ISL-1-like [Artemia franciscana]|uniref:Insulin gene enhancer protein ISL-1 n=1 Tax=Artemia franciscana TaxID=6661 RepID=A0AA88I4S7_ARTSF|nr:hypothetical protein QYM36_003448 [Artemia franciscana]
MMMTSTMIKEELIDTRLRRQSLCAGCGNQITDQYILRVSPDLEWHATCLRCVECRQVLDETCTCYVRNGKTYCRTDYLKFFGAKCAKCGDIFKRTDLVMRARSNVYHVQCFRCTSCSRQLVPGDEFALRSDGLYCREDHETDIIGSETNNNKTFSSLQLTKQVNGSSRGTDSALSVETGGLNVNSSNDSNSGLDDDSCSETVISPKSLKDGSNRKNGSSNDGKPTRVRTVLNEKQLHTLRTCYGANPRPDALMKEQLVEMTGLSPRVIRVWFQNKRCKDKKRQILMKQIQQQDKEGRKLGFTSLSGVPLVATSPVRHGSPLDINPIEVHSYQPPWKALSEFALNADLDRLDPSTPAYQHLINQMHGYDMTRPQTDLGMISYGAPLSDSAQLYGCPPQLLPLQRTMLESHDNYHGLLESDDSLHGESSP